MSIQKVNSISELSKDNYPPILYKYRKWNDKWHKTILTDGVLYLASTKQFQDTKDCNVPEIFPSPEQIIDKDSPLANPQLRDSIVAEHKELFYNTFGVLSMTANYTNDKMWNDYADSHQGFCVGFKSELLFEYVGGGGIVQYVDKLPEIKFGIDDLETEYSKRTYYKERKYEYEQEYRLVKRWQHNATDQQRSIVFSHECLVEIYLGKLMTENDKAEIRNIAANKYPYAKIVEL